LFGESDDEDETRKVRSLKEKKFGELEKILVDCKKHANVKDFLAIEEDFTVLVAYIAKEKEVICAENDQLPRNVLRVLLQLQDEIDNVTSSVKKKMNKASATAFTRLKTRMKQWMASEDNTYSEETIYEKQLLKWKENPEDTPSE